MAFTDVPTVATGDVWTAANHNTYIRDNFAAGVPAIFTAAGDLPYATASKAAARLAIGSVGQVLKVGSGGLPAWEAFAMKLGKASRSSSQSISNATPTAVQFNTEDLDTNNFINLGSYNTRITIPENGVYLFIGQAKFQTDTGVKDVLVTRYGGEIDIHSAAGQTTYIMVAGLRSCSAAEYYELYVSQNSGSSMNLLYGSLSIVKVG